MAISRNLRRQRSKVRKALADTNKSNTAAFLAKQETLRRNCKELGRKAGRISDGRESRGLTMDYSPAHKPLGFTRPLRWSKGVAN